MSPEAIQRSALLDIIFENRNKQYGAYELRTAYNRRLRNGIMIAMLIPIALFAAIRLIPDRATHSIPIISDDDVLKPIVIIEPIKPIDPPKPEERVSPTTTKTTAFTTPDIQPDELVESVPPKISDLQNSLISDFSRDGKDATGILEPPPAEKIGPEHIPETPPAPAAPEILTRSEIMPEFPGGKAGLQRYLSRNLRHPDQLEPGEKRKLIIRFVVDEQGNVGSFVFTEGGEPVYEKEILRVMNRMPQWKPGEQNGRKVKVYFNIPFVFETSAY